VKRQQPDIIEHTITFWRKRTGQEVCHEEARQMVTSVAGFFAVLAEWDHKSRGGVPQSLKAQRRSDDQDEQSPRGNWGSTDF